MWLGVTAAPAALMVDFVAGVIFSDAGCKPGGAGLSIRLWTAIVSGSAAAIAVAGIAAAIAVLRTTRGVQEDDSPPAGRLRFLGTVGVVISPLFLLIIVLSGIGGLVAAECHQS